jgi:hypothetical protein
VNVQKSVLQPPTASILALICLSACHSVPDHEPGPEAAHCPDPSAAARNFFASHYGFYHEDPSRHGTLLTPRFFEALKHEHDTCTTSGMIGALDYDPWIDAQDGHVSEPFVFMTIKSQSLEATVRFDYTFTLGPKSSRPQFVLLKLQRTSKDANWKLADFVTPNHRSLIKLLERNP